MAEYWYNTSYQSSLKKKPFEVAYGFPPSNICEHILPDNMAEDAQQFFNNRHALLQHLKTNLSAAQARMKKYADRKRTERVLEVGDMVCLKMQPYQLNAFGLRTHIKLQSKYYGPFRITAKVERVDYKLLLPDSTSIHPVFHVSQLKKHLCPEEVPNPNLPLLDEHGNILIQPEAILERKLIPRVQGDISIPMVQWRIKWLNLPMENATWEDAAFIQKVFPSFQA